MKVSYVSISPTHVGMNRLKTLILETLDISPTHVGMNRERLKKFQKYIN